MNFLYELILKIVCIARGNILCPAGGMQNNTYQNRKAPFTESGAKTSTEDGKQRRKARRYFFIRIAFIIFIILLCLIMAIASPMRVFALGYASETIVELILSALAGTAAYTFLAAGGAELIACLCIGMAASITVSTIAAAINTAVECGAWSDFVANCQGNFEVRKEKGIMALAMGGSAFLFAYDWVKEHIFGITEEEEDTSSSVPTFEGTQFLNSSTWLANSDNHYSQTFTLDSGATFEDKFLLSWAGSGNHITHSGVISTDNLTLSFSAPQLLDIILRSSSTYDYPLVDISILHYSPLITKDSFQFVTSFKQIADEEKNDIRQFTGLQDCVVNSCSVLYNNKTYSYSFNPLNDDNHLIKPYDGKWIGLQLKDGTLKTSFNSYADFAYNFLYNSTKIAWVQPSKPNEFYNYGTTVPLNGLTETIPVDNKKYYDKDKDTIATTAGSVRTKVKDGTITSDTAGTVTVTTKSKTTANTATGTTTAVTPQTKINEEVKVTDISTTLEGVQTLNPGDAITVGSNNLELAALPMGDKLPFSALKTISNVFNSAFVSKTDDDSVSAPVIPIDFTVMNQRIKFDIDFSPIDPYVGIVRVGLSVGFLITTYLCFKKWLVNKEL